MYKTRNTSLQNCNEKHGINCVSYSKAMQNTSILSLSEESACSMPLTLGKQQGKLAVEKHVAFVVTSCHAETHCHDEFNHGTIRVSQHVQLKQRDPTDSIRSGRTNTKMLPCIPPRGILAHLQRMVSWNLNTFLKEVIINPLLTI